MIRCSYSMVKSYATHVKSVYTHDLMFVNERRNHFKCCYFSSRFWHNQFQFFHRKDLTCEENRKRLRPDNSLQTVRNSSL